MAQITLTGVVKDSNLTIPTSGTLSFQLSDYMIDSAGIIIPAKSETCNISSIDGSFSIVLGSTLDATPSTRTYGVSLSAIIEGSSVSQSLGSIQLAASPTTVLLKDLIISGFSGGTAVTPTLIAADVSLTLKESDQTLPAGLWRVRVNGDILTLEKNTAAGGDFSTLTEIFRSTATLFTVDLNQRLSSTEPRLQFYESDQAADEKLWDFDVQAKVLMLRTRTDADGAGVNILSVTRGTGTAISSTVIGTTLQSTRIGIGVAPDATALLNLNSGLIHGSSTGITIGGSTAPGNVLTVVTNSTDDSLPALGSNGGKLALLRSNAGIVTYGMLFGELGDGSGFVQQQRVDGTATAFAMKLNPNGGGIIIGTDPGGSDLLRVGGTSRFAGIGVGTSPSGFDLDIQTASARINLQPSTTTNGPFLRCLNLSNTSYFGVENSAGSGFGFGASAYDTIVGTASAQRLVIATNATIRLTCDSNGNVAIGTAAIATNATNGFFYLDSCAGAATGVPTTFTGRVAMVYDTTNNTLNVYNGAWKKVTLT
jgi:hypothetical protein